VTVDPRAAYLRDQLVVAPEFWGCNVSALCSTPASGSAGGLDLLVNTETAAHRVHEKPDSKGRRPTPQPGVGRPGVRMRWRP